MVVSPTMVGNGGPTHAAFQGGNVKRLEHCDIESCGGDGEVGDLWWPGHINMCMF